MKDLKDIVSTRSLSAYEAGTQEPNPLTLARLAAKLDFPVAFFYGPDLEEPPEHGASFRALSTLTKGTAHQTRAAAAQALLFSDWIEERFNLPPAEVPRLRGIDPDTAVEVVREEWGLGERPIKNMVHLLEARGIRVFSLAQEYSAIDAYSFWRDDKRPYMFLNTQKSAEHSRMDAAHELGHLVLHWRHAEPRGRLYEQEAEQFGSAFLMPAKSMVAEAPRGTNLEKLLKYKKRWKVSIAALIYRMHTVGVLSDWQYRSLFIEISHRGYRTSEPEEMEREASQILPRVFSTLRDEGLSKTDIASELAFPTRDVDDLIWGLVLTAIAGDDRVATPEPGLSAERPNLRLFVPDDPA